MYGYSSPEEMMQLVTDTARQIYVYPEDSARLANLLKTNEFVEGFETEHYRKDGSRIWVLLNERLIHDTDGKTPLYYEVASEDITTRKVAEEKTRKTLEQLRLTLGATVQAMASTIETRDPYTAGHSEKGANLQEPRAGDEPFQVMS